MLVEQKSMAWYSSVNGISGSHVGGQNHTDRSSAVFRKDEFRTPSPLLPSWHRGQPIDSDDIDEDIKRDFYFHSSENICSTLQQHDVKFMSNGSQNGLLSSTPLEALDNHHFRCITPGLPDSCGFGSTRTDRKKLGEQTCTGSQLSKCHKLINERRSK